LLNVLRQGEYKAFPVTDVHGLRHADTKGAGLGVRCYVRVKGDVFLTSNDGVLQVCNVTMPTEFDGSLKCGKVAQLVSKKMLPKYYYDDPHHDKNLDGAHRAPLH
jgi:hypothetical protein